MFLSSGTLVGKSVTLWQGDTASYHLSPGFPSQYWGSYGQIYRRQLWVAVVVNKRAGMVARLPLPVYERTSQGRNRVRRHAYARLLKRPNPMHDPFTFWTWTTSTFDIFGEAFWIKERDGAGRPVALWPLHPTSMFLEENRKWTYRTGKVELLNIPREDLVIFQAYNPDSLDRGMSRLEPLRATLENEAAARTATSSFWQRGARPGMALSHPMVLSEPAQMRLRAQWDEQFSGANRTGSTLILEEGMKPERLDLSAEEAQYIETRKLNREEVVAAYDMPPPAVHILDHATFSNITEQFRSVYRDTMAPVLGYFESVLETQLRGATFRGRANGDPDFGDNVYAEFLMDEVLRGDFETRQDAYRKADYMTIAEKREFENLPFIPGTDRVMLNAATVPLDQIEAVTQARIEQGRLPEGSSRALGGMLSRLKNLSDVNIGVLVSGLPDDQADAVRAVYGRSVAAGDDVQALRARLRAISRSD